MKDGEPKPLPRYPGTISEETLNNLATHAVVQGWHSLADPALQQAFIGDSERLNAVKAFLKEHSKDGQKSIEDALIEVKFRPPATRFGSIDDSTQEEIQRAILQHELNKMRGPRFEAEAKLYVHDPQSYVIGVESPGDGVVPVFHKFSARTIMNMIDGSALQFDDANVYGILKGIDPYFRGRVKDQIDILKENLGVMDVLFGFGKRLRFENGMYSVVETKSPR